jgi:hypothetical protein
LQYPIVWMVGRPEPTATLCESSFEVDPGVAVAAAARFLGANEAEPSTWEWEEAGCRWRTSTEAMEHLGAALVSAYSAWCGQWGQTPAASG